MEIIPIRTSKEKLSTIEIVDGQLIFVTDDKKIYLDKDTKRIELSKDSLNTWAEGLEAKAYGNSALATGDYSLAFGDQVAATGEGAQAFGKGTITYDTNTDGTHTNITGKGLASGKYSFVANSGSVASGDSSAAFTGATASGSNSFAVGASSVASAGNSISLGGTASGQNSIAISTSSTASGAQSVAILPGAQAIGSSCLAIGGGARAGATDDSSSNIAIGQGSQALKGSTVIGQGSTGKASGAVIIGNGITSSSSYPIIGSGINLPDTVTSALMYGVGFTCTNIANNSIGVGYGHTIKGRGSAFGTGLKTTKDDEFAIGNYNISSDNIMFSIGGGASSAAKNLLEIDNNDNIIGKNFIGEKLLNIWTASTQYIINELVIKDNNIYKCVEAHTSAETFDSSKWTLLLKTTAGVDFNELSTMLTSGSLSGLTITPNEENQNFNITVTGIPSISIDTEGYWLINGERGDNPTKAKGDNGTSPHIDESSKNWFIGETDTGVKAIAGIDDTSTTSTDTTWSANKINSIIGNINTVLASITGEVI